MAHGGGLLGMSGQLDLLAFLTLGLLGSAAHCVGMCAPFVMIVSRRYGVPEGRHAPYAAQLWYTAGRITTYALLGALAGALGGLVQIAGGLVGLQRAAAVVAGVALVVWGVVSLGNRALPAHTTSGWFTGVSRRLAGRMPAHPFSVGLFLGLLPCGLLYSAVVASVAFGGPVESAAALAAFGLGTAPALLGLSLADTLLVRHRAGLNRLSHVFVLVMGMWFLWRGLVPPPLR